MNNKTLKVALGAITGLVLATSAHAAPFSLSAAQMDSVAAGGVQEATGFVCPVISTDAVLNAKNGIQINGAYSILGPTVAVPVNATNTLADGTAGSPGGTFASPGDTGYTAIWSTL
jgi:hypothetical protein